MASATCLRTVSLPQIDVEENIMAVLERNPPPGMSAAEDGKAESTAAWDTSAEQGYALSAVDVAE